MIRPYQDKHPRIHPTAFVEESAQVIGDVEIGEHTSVWFNTVIRGDVHYIRIGARTNIQDLSMLHVTKGQCPLVIGDEVTVAHQVTLHGCTVHDRCLIGMGATVLDRAEIQSGALVAAGALVPPGMTVPSGMLAMGAPAKVTRPLRDSERSFVAESAQNYMEYAASYRA